MLQQWVQDDYYQQQKMTLKSHAINRMLLKFKVLSTQCTHHGFLMRNSWAKKKNKTAQHEHIKKINDESIIVLFVLVWKFKKQEGKVQRIRKSALCETSIK